MKTLKPSYDGMGLHGLANTLLRHFCSYTRGPRLRLDLDLREKVVLILIDGLGYDDFMKAYSSLDISVSRVYKVTSVFPTTTSSALTTLLTGLTPGQHGVLGTCVFIKEVGSVVNTLSMSYVLGERDSLLRSTSNLRELFPIESTIFEDALSYGIRSRVYMPRGVSGGLSRLIYAGAEVVEYITIYDAIVNCGKFLEEVDWAFILIYIPYVDNVGHTFGRDSEEFQVLTRELLHDVLKLAKSYLSRHSVIITSDHGVVDIRKFVRLNDLKGLLDMLLIPPYGDARCIHFRLRPDIRPDEFIENAHRMGLKGLFLTKDDALNLGLFGEIREGIDERLGDVIYIPEKGVSTAYIYRVEAEEITVLKGHHGGLTEDELYVPLIQL